MSNTKLKTATTLSPVMKVMDEVLQNIMWVNADSQVVSLKERLSCAKIDGSSRMMDELEYQDLIGAYTCLQIRYELFHENSDEMTTLVLAQRVKDLVFEETRTKLAVIVGQKKNAA